MPRLKTPAERSHVHLPAQRVVALDLSGDLDLELLIFSRGPLKLRVQVLLLAKCGNILARFGILFRRERALQNLANLGEFAYI